MVFVSSNVDSDLLDAIPPFDFGFPLYSISVRNATEIRVLRRGGRGGFYIFFVDLEIPRATAKPEIGTSFLDAPSQENYHKAIIIWCSKVLTKHVAIQFGRATPEKQRVLGFSRLGERDNGLAIQCRAISLDSTTWLPVAKCPTTE